MQRSLCFGSRHDGINLQPVDVMAGKAWRIGMEHVVVHVGSSAQPVPANRHHSLERSPAALMIGNAEMPVGSLTHVRHLNLRTCGGRLAKRLWCSLPVDSRTEFNRKSTSTPC